MLGNLRNAFRIRRVSQRFVAENVLKMSPANLSNMVNQVGREFAPHERARLCEFFCLPEAWLFAKVEVECGPGIRQLRAAAKPKPSE